MQGRPRNKEYLYDIVNNTDSGLDVDKLDYFQVTFNDILCAKNRFVLVNVNTIYF